MHIHIHKHIHIHIHKHIQVKFIHIYIPTYGTYVRMYVHTYRQTSMHECIHTYIRTYIHTYMHTLIDAYPYTPTLCTHMHTYVTLPLREITYNLLTKVCMPQLQSPSVHQELRSEIFEPRGLASPVETYLEVHGQL